MPEPRITPQRNGSSLREVDARVAHRVDAGDQGELREAIEPLRFLAVDVAVGRPIVDVAAELHLVAGRVERLEFVDAALAAQNPLPQIVDLAAERGDGAHSGYDDASFHEEARSREHGANASRTTRSWNRVADVITHSRTMRPARMLQRQLSSCRSCRLR